jgi:CDP-paratose 2-epimerase
VATKLLITGICGFVGAALARGFREAYPDYEIFGIDNLSRAGSELNRLQLKELGIRFIHGDLRCQSDLQNCPTADWVIDAAANPSVLAGLDSGTSRQLIEHNVFGTFNVLEYSRERKAGLIFLSTSRVYSIRALTDMPLQTNGDAFRLRPGATLTKGTTDRGITEDFPTTPPVSLYGTSKFVSEQLGLEYGDVFQFPVWINRCGVLSGAGQFGRADQGIFSFWIHSFKNKRSLAYFGFGGHGHQVRDCLHPRDLVSLIVTQMKRGQPRGHKIFNIGGGMDNSMSLAQLSAWCTQRFGPHPIASRADGRVFDLPWLVLSYARAEEELHWQPQTKLNMLLEEIAHHAEANPDWLDRCCE